MDSLQMQVPGSSGSSSTTVTAVTVNVATPAIESSATVTDASVSPSSKIVLGWGSCSQEDENHPSMSNVVFNAIPGTGDFTVEIFSMDTSMVFGDFKLQYSIA